ncbi:hypothetical protein ACA910_007777 [Epithemia clementina (nom. ined.)]
MTSRMVKNEDNKIGSVPDPEMIQLSKKLSPPSLSSLAAAAALLDLKASQVGIGPLTVPTMDHYDSRTGLMHGTLRVHKHRRSLAKISPERFEFLLERQDDGDGTNFPLLVAFSPTASSEQKKKRLYSPSGWMSENRRFAIARYNSKEEVMGEVAISPFGGNTVVTFKVTLNQQVDCCILYKVHSLDKILVKDGTSPPREIECVRFAERAKKAARKEAEGRESTKLEASNFLGCLMKECCQLLQPPPKADRAGNSLGISPYKIMCDSNYLSIFHSAQPSLKEGTKVLSLNTKGRGTVTSNKNTQLVNADGVICLQVAKCDSETYHVDFRAPFTPFQAFAFGIAQIVL